MMASSRITNLTEHVIHFIRHLRSKGFTIGSREEIELLTLFAVKTPSSFAEQQSYFKSILVKNRQQFLQFDDLYEDYWKQLSKAEDDKIKEVQKEVQKPTPSKSKSDIQMLKDWLYNGRQSGEHEVAAYSAIHAIGKKDFSAFESGEQDELKEIIRLISKKMANSQSRRFQKSKSRKQLDLKNTMRQALRSGAEINTLAYKEKRIKKTNLILLCDVSRSMELYSQFLIEFMYCFQQANFRIKTFVFSTKLIPLSQTLADGDFTKVLNNLSHEVPYWSGGTRIGASLHEFKTDYGSKLLSQKSVVMILSDGWDTGDIEMLEESMDYLSRKSEKVIWINPLANNPNYEIKTKAMKAAMPYIDVFTSAHNLESLQAVSKHFMARKFSLR